MSVKKIIALCLLLLGPLASGACLQITPLAQCLQPTDCDQSKGEKCQAGICVKPTTPPAFCKTGCRIDQDCRLPNCPSAMICHEKQCLSPKLHTVSQVQSENKAVDILFVVDNSGSMKEEQEKLARNFDIFINELTKSDVGNYQIGIISTDMDSPLERGKLQAAQGQPKIISRSKLAAPAVIEAFQKNVNIGIRGTSYEKPLDAMRAALSPQLLNDPNGNLGFLRPGALLSVFFVGDEDDCSHNGSIAQTELDSEVCRLPGSELLRDDQGNPIPDTKGQSINGRMEDLTHTSIYIEFLKGLDRPVFVSGLIGDPLVYKDALRQNLIDPPGGCRSHVECSSASLGRHKCVFNSTSTRKCGGCTSVINPVTKRPDADAIPGFRLFEVMKAFGGANEWAPICGDDTVFRDTLLRTARNLVDRLQFLILSPAPLTDSVSRFQVEVVGPNGTAQTIVQAQATSQICTSNIDCENTEACGPDKRCYHNGWIYYPETLKQPSTPHKIQLIGNARSKLSPGTTLKVTYPIAP